MSDAMKSGLIDQIKSDVTQRVAALGAYKSNRPLASSANGPFSQMLRKQVSALIRISLPSTSALEQIDPKQLERALRGSYEWSSATGAKLAPGGVSLLVGLGLAGGRLSPAKRRLREDLIRAAGQAKLLSNELAPKGCCVDERLGPNITLLRSVIESLWEEVNQENLIEAKLHDLLELALKDGLISQIRNESAKRKDEFRAGELESLEVGLTSIQRELTYLDTTISSFSGGWHSNVVDDLRDDLEISSLALANARNVFSEYQEDFEALKIETLPCEKERLADIFELQERFLKTSNELIEQDTPNAYQTIYQSLFRFRDYCAKTLKIMQLHEKAKAAIDRLRATYDQALISTNEAYHNLKQADVPKLNEIKFVYRELCFRLPHVDKNLLKEQAQEIVAESY